MFQAGDIEFCGKRGAGDRDIYYEAKWMLAAFIAGCCSISGRYRLCHALTLQSRHHHHQQHHKLLLSKSCLHRSTNLYAKPKRGSVVDSYQTVSVNCQSCKNRLFRYKKKNGTKSNLVKCYVERIVLDNSDGVLAQQLDNFEELSENGEHKWCCPNCGINFGRSSIIHGMPALKLVGGKTRMTKK